MHLVIDNNTLPSVKVQSEKRSHFEYWKWRGVNWGVIGNTGEARAARPKMARCPKNSHTRKPRFGKRGTGKGQVTRVPSRSRGVVE